MTEHFEERLRAALAAGVGDPAVGGLADRARSRLRSRRRTAATVGAVVLAVAAVPVTLALTLPGDAPDGSPVTPPTTSDSTPSPSPDGDAVTDGSRVESWRNITLQVPDDWGYGGGTDWCASGGDLSPAVVRPGAVDAIACDPRLGYGLHFGDGSAINWARSSGDVWQYGWESPDQVKVYPEDAWLGLYLVGDHYAMVVAPDQATARALVTSASRIGDRDPNGCAPRDVADAAAGDGDRWSVCRYGGDGWLQQSELLTVDESEEFLAAVQAAPTKPLKGCPPAAPEEPVGRVAIGSGSDLGSVSVVFESFCSSDNGAYMSGTARELTEDVLYWALSPGWSGGVDGSVPLPDQLRP